MVALLSSPSLAAEPVATVTQSVVVPSDARFALSIASASLALRGSTSLITQWDDHEVRNNWEGDSVDADLLTSARRAFLEHQPFRRNEARPLRYWRSLKWGKTAELFILDSRSERDRARGEYLSPEQLDWLVKGVEQSDAVFKLILNTVPIGAFDAPFFAPFSEDNWQGFPAQREELLTRLEATGAQGVMFLSGDFHFACFGRVAKSGPGSTLFEALVGPGAQPLACLPQRRPLGVLECGEQLHQLPARPLQQAGTRQVPRG